VLNYKNASQVQGLYVQQCVTPNKGNTLTGVYHELQVTRVFLHYYILSISSSTLFRNFLKKVCGQYHTILPGNIFGPQADVTIYMNRGLIVMSQ
jgi:hypothetical protein